MESADPPAGAPQAVTRRGTVAPRVGGELRGLGITWIEVEARPGRSPEPVRRRLRDLADRFYGSHAIHLRERPIPWAYRVFFRHIGLDPDETRTPVEELALRRLRDGTFRSDGLPDDALAIAIVETGVALLALDAERLQGPLQIRESAPGESLGNSRGALAGGTLVVADQLSPAAVLFGEIGDAHAVRAGTRRVAIAAVQVDGVPQIAVDEALHLAAEALSSA